MRIKRRNNTLLTGALLLILSATAVLCVFLLLSPNTSDQPQDNMPVVEPVSEEDVPAEPIHEVLDKIDFQPVVDKWVESVKGDKGIVIYDLDRNEIAASYNADSRFATASIYKLFVVYQGYRLLESGEWQTDEPAGATGYTILECLDLAIRKSNSACAETLWDKMGRDKLEDIVKNDFGLNNTVVEDLVSTPADVAEMMKRYYYHDEITQEDYVAQIKDSFLNQPVTEYNWRQGLPSGFTVANIYNKVGWEYDPDEEYWAIYNDAAIVEYPDEDRHFVVVVMTNNIDYSQIRKLGQDIEQTYLGTL